MESIKKSQVMVCTTSLVRPPALLDDGAQLLKLALRTKQSPELQRKKKRISGTPQSNTPF